MGPMAFILNLLLRLLLLVAGVVFAVSLAFAFLVLLAVWGVRMAWARLTGRPVTPFAMRFGPREAFQEMARRAAAPASPPGSRTPRADAAASGAGARWTRDVTDVDPK